MTKNAGNRRTTLRSSGATAYVALFALAVLQLGVALHHDQHSAVDLTSTCVACVQLEQFDDVVPAADADFVTTFAVTVQAIPVAAVSAVSPLRRYGSRAPPAHA